MQQHKKRPAIIGAMIRQDRRGRGGCRKTPGDSAVSQRNLISIVGAIILILVIAYLLGFLAI